MAITGFLKIPDIAGESKASGHEDEIEIHGVSWGAERGDGAAVGAGRRRSKPEITDLTVLKFYDASSPYLAQAVMQGKSFDEMVFAVRKESGDAHLDYLTITMTNCIVTGYHMENGGTDDPLIQISEAVDIGFENINIKYTVQADDHSAGDEHEIEFDVVAGA